MYPLLLFYRLRKRDISVEVELLLTVGRIRGLLNDLLPELSHLVWDAGLSSELDALHSVHLTIFGQDLVLGEEGLLLLGLQRITSLSLLHD